MIYSWNSNEHQCNLFLFYTKVCYWYVPQVGLHECSFTDTKHLLSVWFYLFSARIGYFDIKYLHLCTGSWVKGDSMAVCKVPQLLEVDITLIFSAFWKFTTLLASLWNKLPLKNTNNYYLLPWNSFYFYFEGCFCFCGWDLVQYLCN